jgi:hypothetical protein
LLDQLNNLYNGALRRVQTFTWGLGPDRAEQRMHLARQYSLRRRCSLR